MKSEYVLYGAGELGQKTLYKFLERDISVVYILDKKVTGQFEKVKVSTPEMCELDAEIRKNVVVIICLNAGMLHKEVAECLYTAGFEKIVFLPMEYSISYKEKVRLTNLYNRALNGEDVKSEVRNYIEYREKNWNDSVTLRCEDKRRIVWIGQEILFSENKLEWKGDKSKVNMINNGIDVNLNAYYWFHDLFSFFDGDREECNSYLSVYNYEPNTEAANRKLLDRERLYSTLKKQLSNGLDFFIEAASEAIWNRKGYFNIVGGNHRTICLQHLGYVYLPAKISEEDYCIWKNEKYLSEVMDYITKNEIEQTYVPIPHPYFKDFPYLREENGNTILGSILKYLGPIRLEGMEVVDASQYEGYFARVAVRMCAEKVTFYNEENKVLGLAEGLFKLLYIQNVEILNDSNILRQKCEHADILFGMLNTKMLLETGCLRTFSGKLFSEFDASDNKFVESILSNTKMNHYTALQRKVYEGKMLEAGVFTV